MAAKKKPDGLKNKAPNRKIVREIVRGTPVSRAGRQSRAQQMLDKNLQSLLQGHKNKAKIHAAHRQFGVMDKQDGKLQSPLYQIFYFDAMRQGKKKQFQPFGERAYDIAKGVKFNKGWVVRANKEAPAEVSEGA